MYAALDIAAALYSSLVIGVVLIVGLIRPDTICAVFGVSVSVCGGPISGFCEGLFGRVGSRGLAGIVGRDCEGSGAFVVSVITRPGIYVTATLGRFGLGGGLDGVLGREASGFGFIPGIVRLDGASSRLKRRKLH